MAEARADQSGDRRQRRRQDIPPESPLQRHADPGGLQANFDEFIADIREKLVNAFSLGWASCSKRRQQAEAELPDPFQALDLSRAGVRFVLVINGHQEAWLPPIQDALKKALHSTVKTWRFAPTSVAVINEELARQHGLILPAQGGAA
ncbi:MAG: hypothetical protein V1816_26665 [Pseudomonadota bacterium]